MKSFKYSFIKKVEKQTENLFGAALVMFVIEINSDDDDFSILVKSNENWKEI